MKHHLVVVEDDDFVDAGVRQVTEAATTAVAERAGFRMAVSGGSTPWRVFHALAGDADFPWEVTDLFQVDERIVAPADTARNVTRLRAVVPASCRSITAMPVDDGDLESACDRYAGLLPAAFDLVHLGLGSDGHTASLVPGDPALEIEDRLVALTSLPYEGHRRMTLTYPALARARQLLWLVSGSDKQTALSQLLTDDQRIPAARVVAASSTVLADRSAAHDPPGAPAQ